MIRPDKIIDWTVQPPGAVSVENARKKMEQLLAENWTLMHIGLIFAITCAQMLVVYVLSDSSNPPAGLGLYTVYFMAALLGWIAYTLQQGTSTQMGVDVPSVASILNSYILFMAAGQRAGVTRGRWILGSICLAACLMVFFLPPQQMFTVQISSIWIFNSSILRELSRIDSIW